MLREGSDAVIIACGIMVHEAMQAAKQLEADGIQAAVIDVVTIKPLDEELVRSYAAKTGLVVTAEKPQPDRRPLQRRQGDAQR